MELMHGGLKLQCASLPLRGLDECEAVTGRDYIW
jgi:hypothetical protein